MDNFVIEGDKRLTLSAVSEKVQDGIFQLHLAMHSDEPISPERVTVRWYADIIDMQDIWHPCCDYFRNLQPDWGSDFKSCSTVSAPVTCIIGSGERNRCTVAVSDAMNVINIRVGASEQRAQLKFTVSFFTAPTAPLTDYKAILRIDTRDIPYQKALAGVSQWWEGMYPPADVPETAKLPMYSTWYSFHQNITPEKIEKQCRLAKEIGCDSVIVDDGWQTADNSLGYGYCGDWEVCPEKIPDMAKHVKRVHDLGMKYMLWYSVPFMGYHAKEAEKFRSMMLYDTPCFSAYVLDPRYSEVRDYLTEKYVSAMQEWGLDGFKLDFVDRFMQISAAEEQPDAGRDTQSVPQAVDMLLSGVTERLRGQNPDVMIEFRQKYIGPMMRKYGNMFRATDCPNDAVMNRVRTIDVRLLCGRSAAHSDMLMWHRDESAESAALQLLNVMFSVPQISVLLDEIPESHVDMLRFYLNLWREHRDLLLFGDLTPYAPGQMYPLAAAEDGHTLFAVLYGDRIVPASASKDEIIICNATAKTRVIVEFDGSAEFSASVYDCTGVQRHSFSLKADGICKIDVPASGTIKLKKQ